MSEYFYLYKLVSFYIYKYNFGNVKEHLNIFFWKKLNFVAVILFLTLFVYAEEPLKNV
jgi:hypothetical protein